MGLVKMTVIGVEHRGMIDPKCTFGLLCFGSQVLPQIIKFNADLGPSSEAHLRVEIHHHWECFCVPQYKDATSLVASHVFAFLEVVNKVLSRLCKKDDKYMIIPLTRLDIKHIIWQMIVFHETVHLQVFMWKGLNKLKRTFLHFEMTSRTTQLKHPSTKLLARDNHTCSWIE